MTNRELWYLGGAGVGLTLIVWKWGNPITAAQLGEQWMTNLVGRGNKLSSSTLTNGVIEETPETLLDAASNVLGFKADIDTYSLARMGRSEGVDGMEYRMHVMLNDLANLQATYGWGVYSSITALMIHSKNSAADDRYSSQDMGKRCSTAKDPYEADYALAQKVQSDHAAGNDPTGGATKFVDKDGSFYVNGVKTDYAGLVANWSNFTPTNLPGATDNFVVFVKNA
jgi:hypothetical protein